MAFILFGASNVIWLTGDKDIFWMQIHNPRLKGRGMLDELAQPRQSQRMKYRWSWQWITTSSLHSFRGQKYFGKEEEEGKNVGALFRVYSIYTDCTSAVQGKSEWGRRCVPVEILADTFHFLVGKSKGRPSSLQSKCTSSRQNWRFSCPFHVTYKMILKMTKITY